MDSDQTRAFLEDLFSKWSTTKDMSVWLDALADDLIWTVTGSTPTSGIYKSKQAYIDGVLNKLKQWVQEEPVPVLKRLIVEGDRASAWLRADAISQEGKSFIIDYCWIMKLRNNLVTEVVGFYA